MFTRKWLVIYPITSRSCTSRHCLSQMVTRICGLWLEQISEPSRNSNLTPKLLLPTSSEKMSTLQQLTSEQTSSSPSQCNRCWKVYPALKFDITRSAARKVIWWIGSSSEVSFSAETIAHRQAISLSSTRSSAGRNHCRIHYQVASPLDPLWIWWEAQTASCAGCAMPICRSTYSLKLISPSNVPLNSLKAWKQQRRMLRPWKALKWL